MIRYIDGLECKIGDTVAVINNEKLEMRILMGEIFTVIGLEEDHVEGKPALYVKNTRTTLWLLVERFILIGRGPILAPRVYVGLTNKKDI